MIALDPTLSALSTRDPARPLRLGLLGGTFNPIHNGHLTIARQTREALDLDRILFIPTNDPPHKPTVGLAPAKDRYEMVRLAITSDSTFGISDIELRRAGKSYSIDTVRQLQQEYGPQTKLFFLIGLDAFLEFTTWREPKQLLKLCSFVVIFRPGLSFQSLEMMPLIPRFPKQALADLDASRLTQCEVATGENRLICLRLPACNISASDIRQRLKQGQFAADQLPPLVESYILKHHLY